MNFIFNIHRMVSASSEELYVCLFFVFIIACMFCIGFFFEMNHLQMRNVLTNSFSNQALYSFFNMNDTVEVSESACAAQGTSAQSGEMVSNPSPEKKEEEAGTSSFDSSGEESCFGAHEEDEPTEALDQQNCSEPTSEKVEDLGGSGDQNDERIEEDKVDPTSSNAPCPNASEDVKEKIREGLIKAALEPSEKRMTPEEKELVDQTIQSIIESIAPSGKLSGSMFLNALGLETGTDWEKYMSGIMAIGRVYDAANASFSIPGLSFAFFWSYASMFLPDNVKRNCLGMFYYMFGATNLKAMADLLNCSTETLIKGGRALTEMGLVVDNERPNATGGGRPDTSTCFADHMENFCLVIGAPQDSLNDMRNLWEINKAVTAVIQKNHLKEEAETQETHVEHGTEEAKGTEQKDGVVILKAKKPDIQDVKKSIDELQSHRERTLVRLEAFLGGLDFKQSYALILDKKIIEDGFSDLEQNLCLYEGLNTLCENGRDTLLDVLMKMTSLLERYMAKIDEIFDFFDKTSYRLGQPYVINRFKTSLPNKDLRDDLYTLSHAFTEYYAFYSAQQEEAGAATGEAWKTMSLEPLKDAAYHSLDTLSKKIRKSMDTQKNASSDILHGLEQTSALLENIECLYETYGRSNSEDVRLCLSRLILSIKRQADKCLGLFTDPEDMDRAKILKVSKWINNIAFVQSLEAQQEELEFFNESASKEDDTPADNVTEKEPVIDGESLSVVAAADQNGVKDEEIERKIQEAKDMVNAAHKKLENSIKELKDSLIQGFANKSNRGRKAKDAAASEEGETDGSACAPKAGEEDLASPLQTAIQKFDGLNEECQMQQNNIPENAGANVWLSYGKAVQGITSLLMEKQDMFEKTEDGEYRPTFSIAQKIAGQVQSHKFSKAVSKNWKEFEYILQNCGSTLSPKPAERFILLEEDAQSRDWYDPDSGFMPPTEVRKIVQALWSQDKNIYDIETWIEYIISQDCARTFGLPTGEGTYCKLTGQQFQNALRYLTGYTVSTPVIKTIVRENMNYANRQAKKMDQVGDASPYKGKQFDIINKEVKEVLESDTSQKTSSDTSQKTSQKTLVISVDEKALVPLGNFKHDNEKILCKGVGKYYVVLDHDFPLTMREVYPNGTTLIDESRLDELAVIRPQGVYCLNDHTGYISLVLNRDTAESMCNLIKNVIEIKKQKMPELEKLIILADGGGSNKANGITWQKELLQLSDAVGLPIEVHHFPMGCSKHNPIEHALFGPISRHWAGKPIFDLEHLGNYISSTHLNGDPHNKVTCWFDGQKYLTNSEKKAIGMEVLTRAKLDAYAKDRIKHPFEKGTDMYKWNYTIYPSSAKAEAAAA